MIELYRTHFRRSTCTYCHRSPIVQLIPRCNFLFCLHFFLCQRRSWLVSLQNLGYLFFMGGKLGRKNDFAKRPLFVGILAREFCSMGYNSAIGIKLGNRHFTQHFLLKREEKKHKHTTDDRTLHTHNDAK